MDTCHYQVILAERPRGSAGKVDESAGNQTNYIVKDSADNQTNYIVKDNSDNYMVKDSADNYMVKDSADNYMVKDSATTYLKIQTFIQNITQNYIWHLEPFKLIHGKGSTCVGDCISDEWFIVHILLQVTLAFDCIATISDSDGQFLLIEAAEFLEKGLDPTNSDNRVFLYKGRLHVIPLDIPVISLESAVKLIRNEKIHTLATAQVEKAALAKANADFSKELHYSRLLVPRLVAHVLYHNPHLIAPAINAFYTRDPIELRKITKRPFFYTRTDLVKIQTKFTRTLYAQMVSSEFQCLNIDMELDDTDRQEYTSGQKVALGLDLLYNGPKFTQKSTVDTYDFDSDKKWKKMLERLSKSGYFDGELAGSQLHNHLIQAAKKSFLSLKRNQTASVTDQMIQFIESHPIPNDFEYPQAPSDSDSWINIDPTQLDKIFVPKTLEDSDSDDEQIEQMDQVLTNLSNFLNKSSDISGVAYEDSSDDDEYQPIKFDADAVLATLKSKLEEPEKDKELEMFEQMMAAMDMELAEKSDNDRVANPDEMEINLNLLKNALESVNAQAGNPGPLTHIINTIR